MYRFRTVFCLVLVNSLKFTNFFLHFSHMSSAQKVNWILKWKSYFGSSYFSLFWSRTSKTLLGKLKRYSSFGSNYTLFSPTRFPQIFFLCSAVKVRMDYAPKIANSAAQIRNNTKNWIFAVQHLLFFTLNYFFAGVLDIFCPILKFTLTIFQETCPLYQMRRDFLQTVNSATILE